MIVAGGTFAVEYSMHYWQAPASIGFWTGALWLALVAIAPAQAVDPAKTSVQGELRQTIADLGADDFYAREQATRTIERWHADPQRSADLLVEARRQLADSGLSADARRVLESLVQRSDRKLPSAVPAAAEIGAALDDLDAAEFDRRWGASRMIEQWLLDRVAIVELFEQLKARQQLADDSPSRESQRHLQRLAGQARHVWLNSNPEKHPLRPLQSAQVSEQIRLISLATDFRDDDEENLPDWSLAEWTVIDRLANPGDTETVVKLIEQRLLDERTTDEGRRRLEALVGWTRPAMVAEIWYGPRHEVIQHLLIGVPSHAVGAPNPSHFDRIDDRVAHCVSGNSLSPGDWPVGRFFPNPHINGRGSQFFLVNLPTARARLAYETQVDRPEAVRYRELSQRTTARWNDEAEPLTAAEIIMLMRLDRSAVLEFLPKYIDRTKDVALDDSAEAITNSEFTTNLSLVSAVACRIGTAEVGRALAEAIERNRVDPQAEGHAWLAVLMIGEQSPWGSLDTKLLKLAELPDGPASGESTEVDLRATAAAALISRAGRSPSVFGLRPDAEAETRVHERLLRALMNYEARYNHMPANDIARLKPTIYQFADEESRQRALRWCRHERRLPSIP